MLKQDKKKDATRIRFGLWMFLLPITALFLAVATIDFAAIAKAGEFSPRQAFDNLNEWRFEAGLPPVEILDQSMSEGCSLHNRYMSETGNFGHTEDPLSPWYTEAGEAAGSSSVLSSAAALPRTVFEDAVYHRTSLLDPRLHTTGYSSDYGFTCMGVFGDDGAGNATDELNLYPWPYDGQTAVPLRFRSSETPDPYDEAPGATQLGYLISVSVSGPWESNYFDSKVSQASMLDEYGESMPLSVSDVNSEHGMYLGGGFGLFPRKALEPGRWYTAHAVGTVTGRQGRKEITLPFDLTWRFRTVDAPPRNPGLAFRRLKTGSRSVILELRHNPKLAGQRASVEIKTNGASGRASLRRVKLLLTDGIDRIVVNRPGRGRFTRVKAKIGRTTVDHQVFRSGSCRSFIYSR